jgi:hypothetical protein
MLRLLTLAAFMLAAASDALAAEATIGGVTVTLPAPAGFCEFSALNPSDQRALTIMTGVLEKSGIKLLSMSADCRLLDDWHSGKRGLLDDFAQYQTPIAFMDKPPTVTVAEICAELKARGDKIPANQDPDIGARVESALKDSKINELGFIGLLAEDPDACYAGQIKKIKTQTGSEQAQMALYATTEVKSRPVFVYRFAVYENSDTVAAVLAKLKTDVAALAAANR